MTRSMAVLSSMMPPSTDSSASRLCGGTRRSVSSIVAITPPPHRERASLRTAGVAPRATPTQGSDETFLRKLFQQPVERRAILLREPLAPPAGCRRLEHQEVPEQETHTHAAREHRERADQRALGRRPPPCRLLRHCSPSPPR